LNTASIVPPEAAAQAARAESQPARSGGEHGRCPGQARFVDIRKADEPALATELDRYCPADSRCAAGDEDGFVHGLLPKSADTRVSSSYSAGLL
jgi:hypothetical protein